MLKRPIVVFFVAAIISIVTPFFVQAWEPSNPGPTISLTMPPPPPTYPPPPPVPKDEPQQGQAHTQRVTATGIVRPQGVTSYMYGTHVLVSDSGRTLYALKSNSINLDDYIGKKVTVSGAPVSGYPIEGGPDYIDVGSINP